MTQNLRTRAKTGKLCQQLVIRPGIIVLAEVSLGFRPELLVEMDEQVKSRKNQQKHITGASQVKTDGKHEQVTASRVNNM